jgi:NADH-quinone oxidoreductase subunit N
VLNSLISAYFYLRVVFVMYMKPVPRRAPAFAPSTTLTAVAALSALAVVAMGMLPAPLVAAATAAVRFLVG